MKSLLASRDFVSELQGQDTSTELHIEPVFRLRRYFRRKLCKDAPYRASEQNGYRIATAKAAAVPVKFG